MNRQAFHPGPSTVRCVLALCAACALAALSGCYTVAGFGKDLESLGDGIEDTALDIAE